MDIPLQRNEDWTRTLQLYGIEDASPIDLTGMTVAMQVRDKLTQTLIASAEIEVTDAVNGEVMVTLAASEGSALRSYGNSIQIANLPYDLRITDADGISMVIFAGNVILSRGETVLPGGILYIDDRDGSDPAYQDEAL